MIKVAVCDDSIEFSRNICDVILHRFEKIEAKAYNKGEDLLRDIAEGEFDIYFLDIEMPEMDGLTLASKIKEINRYAIIIFVTNYEKYVYDSFEVQPFRYLIKNKVELLIDDYINAAIKKLESDKPKYYLISNKNIIRTIPLYDIRYIEKKNKNLIFHLVNDEIILERKSLNAVEEVLDDRFVFADRCYIINIEHIEYIYGNEAILDDGTKFSVPRRRLHLVKEKMVKFLS